MKKFLVLLVSAALVFSMAAVSMAANVKGDFRYDMYMDETSKSGDESYAITDLRFTVEGKLSDSVSALGTFQLCHGKDGVMGTQDGLKMNEYYVTYKESWGGVKAGYYEYKFTPSRVLLKSGQKHVWDKVNVMAATTINLPYEGLTADVLFQPYAEKTMDDGAYGVSLAYNTEKWGAKVTYADFGYNVGASKNCDKVETDLYAFDIYYNINDDMKVFVLGTDWSLNDKNNYSTADSVYNKYGIDGLDPVIGFSWNKIGGTSLFAAVEYAINPRYEDIAAKEFNAYTVNVKYKFNNKVGLEIEHYLAAKDKNKDIVRLRYQF